MYPLLCGGGGGRERQEDQVPRGRGRQMLYIHHNEQEYTEQNCVWIVRSKLIHALDTAYMDAGKCMHAWLSVKHRMNKLTEANSFADSSTVSRFTFRATNSKSYPRTIKFLHTTRKQNVQTEN